MIHVIRRIEKRRKELELPSVAFAKRVRVSRRQVAYWVAGANTPSLETFLLICRVLDVSADKLLGLKLRT